MVVVFQWLDSSSVRGTKLQHHDLKTPNHIFQKLNPSIIVYLTYIPPRRLCLHAFPSFNTAITSGTPTGPNNGK